MEEPTAPPASSAGQIQEAPSGLIRRLVSVNRKRSRQAVLDDTGFVQYANRNVLAWMPRGEGDKVEACFFHIGRRAYYHDLLQEYRSRGHVPADPYSLAQVNIDDRTFMNSCPNVTIWQDVNGIWCFAAFRRLLGKRSVIIGHELAPEVKEWREDWWYAGLAVPTDSAADKAD